MASLNDIETKVHHIIDILGGRTIKTITGVLPLTFTTTEDKLRDWEIRGNDNVGENLFDKVTFNNTAYRRNCTISETATGMSITATGADAYVGRAVISGQSTADYESNIISVNSNVSYTIKMSHAPKCFVTYIDANLVSLGYYQLDSTTFTFTTPADATGILIRLGDDTLEVGQTAEFNNIMLVRGSTAPDHYIPYQQGVGEQRVDGYYVPLTISQRGQTDKTVDIYIGENPLTEGQQVSKTSTGVDIATTEGENTISTTLYNKPEMTIKYK